MVDTTPAETDQMAAFNVGGNPVYLRKPTSGQLYVLYGVGAIEREERLADIMALLVHAEDVLRYMAVPLAETDDEDAVSLGEVGRQLRSGALDLEDYIGFIQAVIEKWGDPEQVEANRADRRAAKKAPAKTAVARPTRTRAR